ncbi:MAG: P-type conjugative transfer protein VirB9 [Pseudomonadota bacterium]
MKNILYLLPFLIVCPALAEQSAAPGVFDPRIRTITYNPRDVVKVTGHYGFQTLIQFAPDEQIENLSIGDSLAWQVVPNEAGNLLFLKPIEENADTNLAVVTSSTEVSTRRIYNFSLTAQEKTAHTDQNMSWTIRFHYTDEDVRHLKAKTKRQRQIRESLVAGLAGPEDWNFDYSFSGDKDQVPKRIFDNGQFTYFEFDTVTDTPAIFLVDKEQNESLVNHKIEGRYVVVHRIGRQFTLRNGNLVTCIFNESFNGEPELDLNSPQERDGP